MPSIDKLIQNRKNMGIEEAILTEARKEGEAKGLKKGLKQGIEQGVEKGIEKGIEKGMVLKNQQFILKGVEQGLSVSVLATLTELTETEVEAIIRQFKKG